MFHKFLLTAILSTSLVVVGQTVSPGPGLQGNGGYVIGPSGNGQVAASTVTFASPASTAGISEAGIAGISDHTPIQQGVQSTLGPSTIVYTSAPPTVFTTSQPSANSAVASEITTESASNDLGASFYSGAANAVSPASGMNASLSLGEVAVQNKTRNGAQYARSYTNTDVQKLLSRNGSGNVMEAANRAPSGVPAPAQNTQVATSSSQNVAQPAQNSSNTPAAEPGNSGVGQGAAANQTQQNAESNAESAGTTPQIRQTQRNDTRQNGQQLPATSTILPLLGLIGLASSGVGLWYRKSRK
ncbi:MAG TPA: hypothetical protein VG488_07745 [Candidatus Angelobacter sp.]|nr:hypothetical protein [Candidatus Angelobacter sp.]